MITLVSVETTPNPNSMKLNFSEPLGVSGTFSLENQATAPESVQQLLRIEGVQSIFTAAKFLTLNRDPRMDWQVILDSAQCVFVEPEDKMDGSNMKRPVAEASGQVQVLVQTFRGLPIQVKVTDGAMEERVGLPPRFGNTARELQAQLGADFLKERYWADWGFRYGTLTEVAQDIHEEIEHMMDDAALARQKQLALGELPETAIPAEVIRQESPQFNHPDWHERLRFVQMLEANAENLPLLAQALQDEKPQIRRWAAAKLAAVKTPQSVVILCDALLNDANVGVRRTAGDSLSDIGDVGAEKAVCKALYDSNKLVRWRAARFLAEVGTLAALPSLERVKNDPEFEVRLEIEAAIQHLQAGSKAAGPVWKLMAEEI